MPLPIFYGPVPFCVWDLYDEVLFAVLQDPMGSINAFPALVLIAIPPVLHMLLSIWVAGFILRYSDKILKRPYREHVRITTRDNAGVFKRFLPPFFSGRALFCILFIAVPTLFIQSVFYWINQPSKIQDPSQFVSDCQELMNLKRQDKLEYITETGWHQGSVVKEQWPASIARIKPIGVNVHDDGVWVMTSTGGIGSSFGYLVPDLGKNQFAHIGRNRTVVGQK
jgi:hypothetical protein